MLPVKFLDKNAKRRQSAMLVPSYFRQLMLQRPDFVAQGFKVVDEIERQRDSGKIDLEITLQTQGTAKT